MAVYEHNSTAPFGAITAYRVIDAADRVVKAVKAKFIADRAYAELKRLSPAQLRDIGLADQDLDAFTREVARRAV